MKKTLKELADFVKGNLVGDGDIEISGIAGIQEAKGGDISFLANPKYVSKVNTTAASAVVVPLEISDVNKPVIKVKDPYLSFAKIMTLFVNDDANLSLGVHETAAVGKNVEIAKGVSIGAYSVIGDGVSIGENTVIYPHVYIGNKTRVGANSLVYSMVSIREKIELGNGVIIHPGAVIGSDGFGFAGTPEGKSFKIPQLGKVVVGDDVEIGANVTIDRGTMGATKIGKGTKIDNLVHIAHNVQIGENCLILGQAGISGSTKIGNNVIIAGQAGIVGHISIGDRAKIGAQAGVTRSIPAGEVVSGYPARPHREALRIDAQIHKLPDLIKKVQALEDKIKRLQEQKGTG